MTKQAAAGTSPRLTPGDWLSIGVILSLLTVVGVPAFFQVRGWIADSTCDGNRLRLIEAIRRYHQETEVALRPGQPAGAVFDQLVQRGYLREVPREPLDGKEYAVLFAREGAKQGTAAHSHHAIQVRVTCPDGDHFHGSDYALF